MCCDVITSATKANAHTRPVRCLPEFATGKYTPVDKTAALSSTAMPDSVASAPECSAKATTSPSGI